MEFESSVLRPRKMESAEMRWVALGGACEEDEIESSDGGGGGTPTTELAHSA
jgi:hypothetical protein